MNYHRFILSIFFFIVEDIYIRPPQFDSSTVKPDRGPGLSFQTATRPPLAGPYAFSRIPKSAWNKPKIYLSDEIQDTWLFTNFSSGYEILNLFQISII